MMLRTNILIDGTDFAKLLLLLWNDDPAAGGIAQSVYTYK